MGTQLDIVALARRANVPVKSPPVELPPEHILSLGKLSPLPGSEEAFFGSFVTSKVELYRDLIKERGKAELAPVRFDYYRNERKRRQAIEHGDRYFESDTAFPPTFTGYLRYLFELAPDLGRVLDLELSRPRFITEPDRRAHTLVTGGSRSGKSELLKRLIHHYVKHPELGGVLVVDPHGEMSRQIARWQEFSGDGAKRLVYLDATAREDMGGLVPALNPIVRGAATDDELSDVADQLANALAFFGADGEGQTGQMQRLAKFVLRVQLALPGSSLMDMMSGLTVHKKRGKGMDTRPAAIPAFVRHGAKHHDEVVADFFETMFDGESYLGTRDALKRRLSHPLEVPIFRRMMTAPDPINLEALLNEGKVVVVNCASAGRAAANTLGRFLMAQVAGIGARRLSSPYSARAPFHVFVDEATKLMAPPFVSILEEFAKTKIWLTMAQQGAGEGADREFVGRVKRSTFLKFIGRSGNIGEMVKLLGLPRDEMPTLEQGQFVVTKTGEEGAAMLLDTRPSPLADNAGAMSDEEWRAVLNDQLATYYRPMKALPVKKAPEKQAEPPEDYWLE